MDILIGILLDGGSNPTTYDFEAAFQTDIDGANGIGAPSTVPFETNGSVTLVSDATTGRLFVGDDPIIQGNQLTTSRYTNRNILGADVVNGQNTMLFYYTDGIFNGRYQVWTFNTSWTFSSAYFLDGGSNPTTYDFEAAFQTDIDGANGIGAPSTVPFETNGSVTLVSDPTTGRLFVGDDPIIQGNQLTTSRYTNRNILGADVVNGQNTMLFYYTDGIFNGRYQVWTFNTSWTFSSAYFLDGGSNPTTYDFEAAFQTDIDGANGIGAPI